MQISNLDTLKAVVAAWDASGGTDARAWLDHAHEDIVMKSIGPDAPGFDFDTDTPGKAQFISYLDWHARTIDLQSFDISEFVVDGDRIVGLGTAALKGRATGSTCTTAVALFVRFRDGKMIEVMEYFDTKTLDETIAA